MKNFKLIVHPRSFGNADLIINPKDFPYLKRNDVVEIYHPEDELNRLVLQVTSLKEDLQGKDVISVEQSIASTFQLKTYQNVIIAKIDPITVALDSVEVTLKDQYFGRSEMWRLKNLLINTCTCVNKKIEFCGGTSRLQVYELWAHGENVASGFITEDTKLVFRSSTSMVYLFLQMSSEMWDFDIHGDLYFEKAVDGFLTDLFARWKKEGSNHDVTIVLFSRVYYRATHLDEFPDHMRECLQQDYRGRFYEDFYRVVVQNEKYEDWSGTLTLLRSLFQDYRQTVLEYYKKPGIKMPKCYLSSAAQGNFLEVLNISLNVFEKHYVERSLDRTGQLSVVISPGVGVFEVDRELTNVTKQRIIDNGVGNDLVCIGEQPLHAVPLFKFHNKDAIMKRDDYSMPHWINLSFYFSEKKISYSQFIPRIRLPPKKTKSAPQNTVAFVGKPPLPTDALASSLTEGGNPNCEVDYDGYDNDVFAVPYSHATSAGKHANARVKKNSLNLGSDAKAIKWKMSDPNIYHSLLDAPRLVNKKASLNRSNSIAVADYHCSSDNKKQTADGSQGSFLGSDANPSLLDEEKPSRLTNSAGSSASPRTFYSQGYSVPLQMTLFSGKALINPFDPSNVTIKMTSNRRRWTHVFPKGPRGTVMQPHHYQRETNEKEFPNVTESSITEEQCGSSVDSKCSLRSPITVGSPSVGLFGQSKSKTAQSFIWGVTGEQVWKASITTGVDWKSLTIPACLPITTDYFPTESCLQMDYVFSDYNLLPDAVNADYAKKRAIYKKPLTTKQVFHELISQRLARGFQIVIDSDAGINFSVDNPMVGARVISGPVGTTEFRLSIGRIFHRIKLRGSEIIVTRYRPRHPYAPFVIHYRYRFQAPDHSTYGTSRVTFNAAPLENYKWNYLDHYICTRGDTDFPLTESTQFWRFRLYALPLNQPATKKILEGSKYCDIYEPYSPETRVRMLESFLKYWEVGVNKVKRDVTNQKQGECITFQKYYRRRSTSIVYRFKNQPENLSKFRERVGSNREKKRARSGSTIVENPRFASLEIKASPILDYRSVEDNLVDDVFVTQDVKTNEEIARAMQASEGGLQFLAKQTSIPNKTFISYDAVMWIMANVGGVYSQARAVKKLDALRMEHFICHASGDFSHPFIFGFYLYFIVPPKAEKMDSNYVEPINDLITFENEWAEIECIPPSPEINTKFPRFACHELLQDFICTRIYNEDWTVPFYKDTHLEVDPNNTSDRIEWGHASYQSECKYDRAYEMVIKWMAASGSVISDMILTFSRRAQLYNFQLVPVPADPHALPYSVKSDPLRGPVFIPLNVEPLLDSKSHIFEEFDEETWHERMVLLQEAIASRFGFISCVVNADTRITHQQYVHLTGNIFLLIASAWDYEVCQKSESNVRLHAGATAKMPEARRKISQCGETGVSPHLEYITRHVTESHNDQISDNRIGFLWSWNHMVNHRWKWANPATNDEKFQDKLLLDFRNFCANRENRLKIFWNSCWDTKYSDS